MTKILVFDKSRRAAANKAVRIRNVLGDRYRIRVLPRPPANDPDNFDPGPKAA